jgi:hypothetical protein
MAVAKSKIDSSVLNKEQKVKNVEIAHADDIVFL